MKSDGWRDASREQPDNSDDVLVFYADKYSDKKRMEIGRYHSGVFWPDTFQRYYTVIAWRPLPDPPAFG
jgi:hypothetical protein